MTDKNTPPLNLIERMAQRMAKQDAAAGQTAGNGAEASAQANGVTAHEPLIVGTKVVPEPLIREPAMGSTAAPEPAVRGPAIRSTPAPEPVRQAPAAKSIPTQPAQSGPKSREVGLDIRVLRYNGMITPDNMASAISNEFRGIKRKLLRKARDPELRATVNNLIMVTSSLPGEGKTFTSINLAISLAAERGLQVLLIDADVVRPSVGNIFKSIPKVGLTDLLSGKVSNVSDVMCRCAEIPNLAVIFAGSVLVESPELISSGKMADLCTELSSRYPDRIIVIDTPPVLASPEPATLAAYVHQLVMVVAADQTDRHQLRKSLEAVATCPNVSLLFNKAPHWNEAQYGQYYGYAYSTNAATPTASS